MGTTDMHNPSTPDEDRVVPLDGQLRDRLQLATAFQEQIASKGTICLSQMSLAMESFGLELPSDLPLSSYTQYPSTTNLERTKQLMSVFQEQTLIQLVGSFKKTLKSHVQHIRRLTQRADSSPPPEELWRNLKLKRKYWDGVEEQLYHLDSTNATIQTEQEKIHAAMKAWHALGQIGPESITLDNSLYTRAEAMWKVLSRVARIDHFAFENQETQEVFMAELGALTVAISASRHIDAPNTWSPKGLVDALFEFNTVTFQGAIPYRLQEESDHWDTVEEWVDTLTESEVLQSDYLKIAEGIGSYLHYCWFLHDAHVKALQTATIVTDAAYNLRTLIA
jgi:hypothetical protein